MIKARKILISILALILVCSTLALVACKNDEIELESFDDVTITAYYNEEFSVSPYITAVTTSGKAIKGYAEIFDSKNNPVTIFANRFKIRSMEGYSANISVEVARGDVRTRRITINVVDRTKATFSVSKYMPMGAVGVEYSIPEITATQKSGMELPVSFEVFMSEDGVGNAVIENNEYTITDNKFTPDKKGIYTLVASAVDTLGNVSSIDSQIIVRDKALAENVIEDFSDDRTVKNIFTDSNTAGKKTERSLSAEWLENYELNGETKNGVAKIDFKKNNNYLFATFSRTYEELKQKDYDYYKIVLGTEKTGSHSLISWTQGVAFEGGAWQEVILTKQHIDGTRGVPSGKYAMNSIWSYYAGKTANEPHNVTNEACYEIFYRNHSMGGNGDNFFTYNGDLTVYVDSIEGYYYKNPQMELSKTYNAGTTLKLNATVKDLKDYSIKYTVKDPANRDVTLGEENSLTLDIAGDYKIKAELIHASEKGVSEYIVSVPSNYSISVDESTEAISSAPIAKLVDKDGNEASGYETTVLGSDIGGGKFRLVYELIKDGVRHVKIINPTFTERQISTAENLLEDYDHPSSLNNISRNAFANNLKNGEWLAEFKGKTGVVKTYTEAGWGGFYGKFFVNYNDVKDIDFEKIVVTAYFEGDGESIKVYGKNYDLNKWVEVEITESYFKTNPIWRGLDTNNDGNVDWDEYKKAMSKDGAGKVLLDVAVGYNVYLDAITYVAKNS